MSGSFVSFISLLIFVFMLMFVVDSIRRLDVVIRMWFLDRCVIKSLVLMFEEILVRFSVFLKFVIVVVLIVRLLMLFILIELVKLVMVFMFLKICLIMCLL